MSPTIKVTSEFANLVCGACNEDITNDHVSRLVACADGLHVVHDKCAPDGQTVLVSV